MRHVSLTHRVALDWLFDRINLDPKIQIKYIDTKNQLADMLTKGNFTRDEWNHLLCLFNISHFSSTDCSEVMSKRTQEDSGEERVTAKLKPMMNLIARAPSTLSSSASERLVKRSYESQSPISVGAMICDGTVKPVVCRDTSHEQGHHHKQFVESSYSARYSRWDNDKAWSSQEWKADKSMGDRTGQPVVASWARTHEFQSSFSHEKTKHDILEEEEIHDRTGQPVVCPQRGAMPQQFIIGDDEAELELSSGSTSFLDRVNDQVRKRQKRSSMNVTENDEKHSVIWGMFLSSTLEHGEELLRQLALHQEYKRSHNETNVRHICEIGVWTWSVLWSEDKIDWENSSWKYLSLIGDEEVINLQRTKVYVFSDSVLYLGTIHENPQSNIAWEERLEWFKSSLEYRTLDRIDGEPMELEWNIFQGFNTLQLSQEVQELMLRLYETPENFTGRIIFMSMFNDISWGSKDNKRECESNAQLLSLYAKRFEAGQWSFLGPGSEKKWYSITEDSPQGEWDTMAEKMMVTLAESGHPVFRVTSPLSRGQLKSKGKGQLSIHYCVDQETIETVFRTITSVNQLSLFGAVAEMCEEYESYHDRTMNTVVGGQSSSSFVPSVIKTNVPLNNAHKDHLLQRYGERIEKLSQQDRLSKFFMDAGFLNVVEIGQYFMTKDIAEFSQFTDAVACREYTLPRDEDISEAKGWIRGNTKIGSVLEVTTCCLQGKYGVEIRIVWTKTILTHVSEFLMT